MHVSVWEGGGQYPHWTPDVQQWTHFPGLKSKYGVCNLIMEVKHYVLGSVGFTMHKELHVAQDIT